MKYILDDMVSTDDTEAVAEFLLEEVALHENLRVRYPELGESDMFVRTHKGLFHVINENMHGFYVLWCPATPEAVQGFLRDGTRSAYGPYSSTEEEGEE